ncbi:magnesium transporter [Mycena leptocephala]|nr:magnesium transporter [Mycena leptocephala]
MVWRFSLRHVKAALGTSVRAVSNPGQFDTSISRSVLAAWRAPQFSSSRHLLSSGTRRNLLAPGFLVRNISRGPKQSRTVEFDGLSDIQEEATRAAILEKVMKGRQPTDLMLRCKLFHSSSLSDLCGEHRLNPRDLRKIDSRVPNLVPTILVRREAFLVNILHIRALVKADTVVLFDTFGSADSRLHSVFLYHLEHNLKTKGSGLPYEFRALESILLSVLSALEAEMVFIRNLVGGLLAELEDNIDHDRFKRLLHYSRRLASFQNRAKLVEEVLEEVLGQDDDLTAMYLTDKKNDIIRELDDHEDLEVLLESFSKQVEEIVNEAENIEVQLSSNRPLSFVTLHLDERPIDARNCRVSIMTMGIGSGALVAGLFGMNPRRDSPMAFYGMTGFATALATIVAWSGLRRLAKIRKVGLSNTNNRARRKPWLPSRCDTGRLMDGHDTERDIFYSHIVHIYFTMQM